MLTIKKSIQDFVYKDFNDSGCFIRILTFADIFYDCKFGKNRLYLRLQETRQNAVKSALTNYQDVPDVELEPKTHKQHVVNLIHE